MTLAKENQILQKKLNKKEHRINKLITSSRIKWRKWFYRLLILSIIIISFLLIAT